MSAATFPDWQPIETAPTDEIVLLVCADWPPAILRGQAFPIKVGYQLDGEWTIWGASWQPTHWMPLPPPPSNAQSGAD